MPSRLKEIMEELKGIYKLELDREGHFISFPDRTRRFLGYSEEEVKEMSIFDLVAEEDLEKVLGCVQEGPEIEPGTKYDISILHKNGQKIAIKAEPYPIFEDGKVMIILCKFMPIEK
jgi:PAS domain S-box-containing protein